MTDKEKAIVMAHTGICMLTGDKFQIFHKYVEDIMGRPIMTHEIGQLADTIKEKTKADFIALCADESSLENPNREPCDDAISRQAVLDKKKLVELEDGQSFYCISPEDVETLQPVTPQPKLGEWIVHEKPYGIRYLECPYCNIWYLNEHLIRNSFCHNCGAKMIVLQERSGEE